METRHRLQGIELRYALTMYLLQHGPTTVNKLVEAMEWQGFHRRAAVETGVGCVALGEAARQGSSTGTRPLRPGYVPRGTEYRIHNRVMELRAAAKPLWFRGVRL